jgi:hypothetical protein
MRNIFLTGLLFAAALCFSQENVAQNKLSGSYAAAPSNSVKFTFPKIELYFYEPDIINKMGYYQIDASSGISFITINWDLLLKSYYLEGYMFITGLQAIEDIAVWLYQFKKVNMRVPVSLEDLVANAPSNPTDQVKKLYVYYRDNCKYDISYTLLDGDKVEIMLITKNSVCLLKNDNDKYFFYEDGVLVIEYLRNQQGLVVERKEYF